MVVVLRKMIDSISARCSGLHSTLSDRPVGFFHVDRDAESIECTGVEQQLHCIGERFSAAVVDVRLKRQDRIMGVF